MVKRDRRMNMKEVSELMKLKGWSQADLARELEMSRAAICRWFGGEQQPTGPARILMRQWLSAAREESRKQPA